MTSVKNRGDLKKPNVNISGGNKALNGQANQWWKKGPKGFVRANKEIVDLFLY